jgi:hypothetical protein
MKLSPIQPLVKEFLQAITQFNPKIVKLVVQGVPIFITKNIVAKILKLPKICVKNFPYALNLSAPHFGQDSSIAYYFLNKTHPFAQAWMFL